jgi:hypothetical protein
MANIEEAIHWWSSETSSLHPHAFPRLRALFDHFFYCANSLYPLVKVDQEPAAVGKGILIDSSGTNGIYFINKPSGSEYAKIRGILSLVGDMVLLIRAIRGLSDKLDTRTISVVIDRHEHDLRQLHSARHFFTHFDERIGNGIDAHGVTGELEVKDLRLVFRKEAKGCFYLAHLPQFAPVSSKIQ